MTNKLRVGIVGAGFIGVKGHLPGYQRHPGTEVMAICDENGERARDLANEHAIPRIFTDYGEMLLSADLDVVSVCTPNALHAPVTIAALDAGAHVICEKPMALTVAEAERMVAAARRADRKLTIAFHNRFRPSCQVLKQFVEAGILGEIYYATVSMLRRSGIPGYGSWFTNKDLAGGGALIDNGVHGLDLALWFMGHPRPVSVTGVTFSEFGPRRRGLGGWGADIRPGVQRFDVDDLAAAMIRFENGAVLRLEASWAGYSAGRGRLQLFGREGGAELDMESHDVQHELRLFTDLHGRAIESTPDLPYVADPFLWAHEKKIEDFVAAIVEDRDPLITPQQGVLATQVMAAIYESAQLGHEVNFSNPSFDGQHAE